MPITEDEKQAPINPYGNTKLAVERALADYAAAYPFGFCALRYFNAAGAGRGRHRSARTTTPRRTSSRIVFQAALGQRPHVEIFGTDYPTPDGTCVRDYIHVDDLAAAHILALEKIAPGSAAGLQRRHRPRVQRPRGHRDGRGGDRQADRR